MAKDHSFDVVSEVNLQEVSNAVDQSKKEIATRYDFKDSNCTIDWDKQKKEITLHAESDFKLRSIIDILQSKLVKRGVSIKSLDYKDPEKATGMSLRQTIAIIQGIPIEKAKEIVKFIKDSRIKVQTQIQGDQLRVQSGKIDNLQEAMKVIKQYNFGLDLQYLNYR